VRAGMTTSLNRTAGSDNKSNRHCPRWAAKNKNARNKGHLEWYSGGDEGDRTPDLSVANASICKIIK